MADLNKLTMGVIVVIALLFVGLLMISKVSVITEKDFYAYGYTTVSNATAFNLTAGAAQVPLTVGTLSTVITGETPIRTLFVNVDNKNTTHSSTITVLLNGTSLGTFSAVNGTATNNTFTLSSLTAGYKNVTVSSSLTSQDVWLNTTSITYESSRTTTGTDFGSIFSGLTTSVGTVFDVLVLTVIIVCLGFGIGILRGLGSTVEGSTTGI